MPLTVYWCQIHPSGINLWLLKPKHFGFNKMKCVDSICFVIGCWFTVRSWSFCGSFLYCLQVAYLMHRFLICTISWSVSCWWLCLYLLLSVWFWLLNLFISLSKHSVRKKKCLVFSEAACRKSNWTLNCVAEKILIANSC